MAEGEEFIFPKGFLWGTATSAHQTEGGNFHSDWWEWEKNHKLVENSGIACDHYHKFKADFNLAKQILHNNAHRFSIEWAKIEPEEGKFDQEEVSHYREVLQELKKLDLSSLVTLHHFTNPAWFAKKGGWEKRENIYYFEKFVWKCAEEFGDLVDYWIIFNEPNVYAQLSYMIGHWPPQKKNLLLAFQVLLNLALAHKKSYRIIHQKYNKAKVTSVINMSAFKSYNFIDNILIPPERFLTNYSFLSLTKGHNDFVGINYYFLHISRWADIFLKNLERHESKTLQLGGLTDVGWPSYPQGIYQVIKESWNKYKLPIIITENGMADALDEKRPRYIIDHLNWVYQAIKEGTDVRGYFYWTLMDNFEWDSGRKLKFGLFETNYKTLERIPRKSAYIYGKICQENAITKEVLDML